MRYTGQKHAYRVTLSGLGPKAQAFYRSVGGLVVLATSPERAKRAGLYWFRATCGESERGTVRNVRAVGVVDLGHRGTDERDCPICAGAEIDPNLFAGRA